LGAWQMAIANFCVGKERFVTDVEHFEEQWHNKN
jgi:hypothetical protein